MMVAVKDGNGVLNCSGPETELLLEVDITRPKIFRFSAESKVGVSESDVEIGGRGDLSFICAVIKR